MLGNVTLTPPETPTDFERLQTTHLTSLHSPLRFFKAKAAKMKAKAQAKEKADAKKLVEAQAKAQVSGWGVQRKWWWWSGTLLALLPAV